MNIRDCLPGKVYEFIVGSNNVPSETESDVREIVVPPGSQLRVVAISIKYFQINVIL